MCGDHEGDGPGRDERAAAQVMGMTSGLGRRAFLAAVGAGAGALLLPGAPASADGRATFTGQAPVLAALHVHGPDDEQTASLELQLQRAVQAGYALVVPTPHGFRALAEGYLTSLLDADLRLASSGAAAQRVADHRSGVVHLRLEAAGSGGAQSLLTVETGQAQNRLRTTIAGTTLAVRFGSAAIGPGGLFEVVVTLSDRLDGGRSLRYRWGPSLPRGRSLQQHGQVGVVTAPVPAAGSTATLHLVDDAAALWPQQVPTDNGLVQLGLCATSPRRGCVVDVSVTVGIDRSQHDEQSVVRRTRQAVDRLLPRTPGLTVQPSVEISALDLVHWPHLNLFGVPQRVPSNAGVRGDDIAPWCRRLVTSVRAAGGVASWNHPLGVTGTAQPLLSRAEQVAQRRTVAARLLADDAYGCEVLEVGYASRGGHDLRSHLELWDVLSRNGRWFTGSGANDDHLGGDWRLLGNGYGQALLLDGAPSVSLAAVSRSLRAGRSFFVHPTLWPHAGLDLLVDGFVRMGGVDISSAGSRRLEVAVSHLPADAQVRVVQGAMDRRGLDPLVQTVATWSAGAFGAGGTGTRALALDTTRSSSVRVEVVRGGRVVGGSNPVYLQREAGPRPVPAVRSYR